MTKDLRKIIEIEIPMAEAADLMTRAASLGVSFSRYAGVLALAGAYGVFHPEVMAFRKQAAAGICGPKTEEGGA